MTLSKIDQLQSDAKALEDYLAPRHVADVVRDLSPHGMALFKPEQLVSALRPLQPRLYSISSSPLEGERAVQVSQG